MEVEPESIDDLQDSETVNSRLSLFGLLQTLDEQHIDQMILKMSFPTDEPNSG